MRNSTDAVAGHASDHRHYAEEADVDRPVLREPALGDHHQQDVRRERGHQLVGDHQDGRQPDERLGLSQPGPKTQALTDLTRPAIDWPALAEGFGVPGSSVHTDGEFAVALLRSLGQRGPSLIEAVLA